MILFQHRQFFNEVGAGGNAPLVSFRLSFVTTGLQAASRISASVGGFDWLQAAVLLRITGSMKPGSGLLGRPCLWLLGMVAPAGLAPASQCFQGTALESSISTRSYKGWERLAPSARDAAIP